MAKKIKIRHSMESVRFRHVITSEQTFAPNYTVLGLSWILESLWDFWVGSELGTLYPTRTQNHWYIWVQMSASELK